MDDASDVLHRSPMTRLCETSDALRWMSALKDIAQSEDQLMGGLSCSAQGAGRVMMALADTLLRPKRVE